MLNYCNNLWVVNKNTKNYCNVKLICTNATWITNWLLWRDTRFPIINSTNKNINWWWDSDVVTLRSHAVSRECKDCFLKQWQNWLNVTQKKKKLWSKILKRILSIVYPLKFSICSEILLLIILLLHWKKMLLWVKFLFLSSMLFKSLEIFWCIDKLNVWIKR